MTQDEIMAMWNSVIKYAPSEVRITEFAKLVAVKEREACAKVVDDIEAQCIAKDSDDPPLKHVAAAIRARGQA